jgi:hypothetical protein
MVFGMKDPRIPDEKTCKTCGEVKSSDEFCRHPETRDRLRQSCKPCEAARIRRYRAANREHVNRNDRERRAAQRAQLPEVRVGRRSR